MYLIKQARSLYAKEEPFPFDLPMASYVFDSTTIDLCLLVFPWARFMDGNGGKRKGAIKLHTLLDLRGNIPTFIHISDGKMHDARALDLLILEANALYVFDRAYTDYKRLYRFVESDADFVTRSRRNTQYRRIYSRPIETDKGVRCDQIIALAGETSQRDYPDQLRRIRYRDKETGKTLVFLTNNLSLPASTIANLYRARWQVELFFKWVKQHLKIKRFYGTSPNAVKSQVWIAVITYVLVAIVKKRLKLEQPMYSILQFLSVSPFEKTPILHAFSNHIDTKSQDSSYKQLSLL